jgi:hypothetical protein
VSSLKTRELMTQIQTRDELLETLTNFHERVRTSVPVRKLIARWDRLVEVRTLPEPGRSFFLRSRGGEMLAPSVVADGPADITIAAEEDVLRGIFSGEINPARAHLDGHLQAIGSQKDQLVLDSIVLLIWGY